MPFPVREIELIAQNIPIDIVYEDDELIIVNKSVNMVVHPGYGNYSGTLLNALIYHFSDSILNYNIEIEKSIKSHCNSIISIISTLSISDKEETINIINLFHSYNALFNKWKLYGNFRCCFKF